MFASDRDLLVLEPNLFRDFVWLGQRLVAGEAQVSDNLVSFVSQDVPFEAAAVGPGHVVYVGGPDGAPGASYEVMERLSDTELTVSRIRCRDDGPVIPPSPVVGVPAHLATFAPQLAAAHRRAMRLMGIETLGAAVPGQPRETQITNPRALCPLESLWALEMIMRAAGTLLDQAHPINQKAQWYGQAAEQERERVVAYVDTNGDGVPDAARKLNGPPMVRG